MLGKRGFPLECAAAQVCREAGARVASNVFVRDMDFAAFDALDQHRLEIVADGFTLWRGGQLAIDTTMVSTLERELGQGQLITMVLCWRWRDAGRKQPALSSPGEVAALVLWSSLPKLVGGGTVRRRSSSQLWLEHVPRKCLCLAR